MDDLSSLIRQPDLVVSLGPNCRSAWNVRDWFGCERAYPFDWWITPPQSLLRMLQPDFVYRLEPDHLIIPPSRDTVINTHLYILQHHDFARDQEGYIQTIDEHQIARVNSKYQTLFRRLLDDVASAKRPLFVLNGLASGLGDAYDALTEQGATPHGLLIGDVIEALVERFGAHIRVLNIEVTTPEATMIEPYDSGLSIKIADDGQRIAPQGAEFAEPVSAFQNAFSSLNLRPLASSAHPAPSNHWLQRLWSRFRR